MLKPLSLASSATRSSIPWFMIATEGRLFGVSPSPFSMSFLPARTAAPSTRCSTARKIRGSGGVGCQTSAAPFSLEGLTS